MMKSIAGQPMAVNVSLISTIPSHCERSTIKPMSTTLIGISGSITSRKASHRVGQDVSSLEWVCRDGYVVVMAAAPEHTYWFSFRHFVKIYLIVYHYLLILLGQQVFQRHVRAIRDSRVCFRQAYFPGVAEDAGPCSGRLGFPELLFRWMICSELCLRFWRPEK